MSKVMELILAIGGISVALKLAEFFIGIVAEKWIKPWVFKTEKRAKTAQEIAYIADDLTDFLRARYPDQKWDDYLDDLTERLIEECGLHGSQDVAKTAATAAIARKKDRK